MYYDFNEFSRHEVVPNNTIIIRQAERSDMGRYTCMAKGRQGDTAMADTFLHVLSNYW